MNEEERPYHPAANLFPLMQGDEYEALRADIDNHGQRDPIHVDEAGAIIDGRNRHRACLDLDIVPRLETWRGDSVVAFVVSANLHRRHLNSGQRAAIALDVLPMLEADAKERQRGGQGGILLEQRIAQANGGQRNPQAASQAADMFGTNRQYVKDAKKMRDEAPDLFEQIKAGEITIPQAKTHLRRAERVVRINELSHDAPPLDSLSQRYPIVYADPPWRYEHIKTDNRAIENQYPTMALNDICALPVGEISTPDSVLFLWATNPKLAEAMIVINSWGYTYRTNFVWVKDKIGMGYYARQQHELLLVAARGSLPVPEPANRQSSVIEAPRQDHSSKPPEFYQIIERMYPEYDCIELFARSSRAGWSAWGNEL